MAQFLQSQLDYIYFFYGSAFLLLIPICLFLRRRSCRKLPWLWLGWFGALHGANEWLDLLALSLEPGPEFDLVRLGVLIMSFVCLAEFGRAGTRTLCGRGPGPWILAAMVALVAVGGLAGIAGVFAAARYILGLVGALWAAGALFLAAKTEPSGSRPLQIGALGLAGYALAAGLVVTPAPFFPASWLNYESFFAVSGVPIQLLRALIAILISASLCFLAQTCLERDHYFRVWFRHLTMWIMAGLTLLLISGWGFTQYLGHIAARDKWDDYEHDMEMVRQSLMDKMVEADRLVKILSTSPVIFPALANRTPQTIHQANSVLDVCSQTLLESVCYLMDLNGLTIASSNRGLPDSFLDKSYAFRPYFRQAIQGSAGRYWALGVTSKELGYYASFPVRDNAGQIIGAAVIKRAFAEMQSAIHQHYLGLTIDQRGIVVMSNRPDMILRSLWPLSAAARQELVASRQFGDGPFTPILTRKPADKSECLVQGKRMLVLVRPLPCEGCSVVIFGSIWPIAQARLLGISATLLFCLVLTGFLTSVVIMRESEEGFRQLFDNAADILILHDKGRIIRVNQQACHCLGYTREEFLGRSLFEIEVAYSKEFLIDLWKKGAGVTAISGIYRRKDGTTFPAEIRASEITYRGRTLRLAAARDITERKQSEEALLESEKRFRDVAENAHEWVWEVDAEGKYTYASPIVEKLLGYKPEEMLSKHFYDLFIPEERERFRETALATFADKLPFREFINWNLHKDGSIVCLSTSGVPIFDKTGNFLGYRGVDIDITKRKKGEEALRDREAKYRAAVETSADGFCITDMAGRFLEFNDTFAGLLGFSREELLSMTVPDIEAQAAPAEIAATIEKVRREGHAVFETKHRSKDGRVWPAEVNLAYWPIAGGRIFVFVQDITDRKRAEEALAASKEELQKSKENYQTLAGQLLTTHETEWKRLARELHDDLTQRLAALAMEAERLELQMPSSGAGSAGLKAMKDQIVQLSMDTHALSRRLHPSILEDLGLADAVVSELAAFRQRNENILVYYQLGGIPPGVPQDLALCIYRILQEGLNNISRHARATKIDISLVGKDGLIHLTIKDNGIGFDPDQVKKKGGLGLASMQERAYLVGGDFYLRSQPGKGTVIEVRAPLSRSTR